MGRALSHDFWVISQPEAFCELSLLRTSSSSIIEGRAGRSVMIGEMKRQLGEIIDIDSLPICSMVRAALICLEAGCEIASRNSGTCAAGNHT